MDLIRTAAAACVAATLSSLPAHAALGGAADTVQADAAALKAQVAVRGASHPAYTVQRLTLASGTVVDEYVSASGTVFALNWRGATPPDLSQLFGSYYAEYQAAATQPHVRSSHLQLQTANLRYTTGGHMRDLWGTIYVPALMPSGLTLGDLQ